METAPVPRPVVTMRGPLERIAALPVRALLALFMAILLLRHPQAILHADFWAEDGFQWYADAYQSGFPSLFWPHSGYLQTISRLVALIAQGFPLRWGPTIFALAALVIQALPPTLVMSERMADAWPDRVQRFGFALLYVALPNSFEVLTNLTNAQWHLASVAFLIVMIRPSTHRLVTAAECAVLAVAGLSGPFAIFLLPIAIWQYLQSHGNEALARLLVLASCVCVQVAMLALTMGADRLHAPLGAGLIPLARILAPQVILGALLGVRILLRISRSVVWAIDAVPLAITLTGLLLTVVALRRGSPLLAKGVVYAALILGAALISPVVTVADPQWAHMALPGAGNRYYLIPMLAWLGVLFTLANDRIVAVRRSALGFLMLLLPGLVADFYYPGAPPTDFAERAREFGHAPVGTVMTFPVHPPEFLPMVLTKR